MKKQLNILCLMPILLTTCACNNQSNNPTAKHDHIYQWQYDSRNHYQVCSCGDQIGFKTHSFKEIVEENTIKTFCDVCNYQKKVKTLAILTEGIRYADNSFFIENEQGLLNFANILNGTDDSITRTTFQNSSVKLTKNLDMSNYEWIPYS